VLSKQALGLVVSVIESDPLSGGKFYHHLPSGCVAQAAMVGPSCGGGFKGAVLVLKPRKMVVSCEVSCAA